MAEVLLFHHVLGLTPGVLRFADDLRAGGHVVHTPDLLDGKTFDTLEEGIAYAEKQVGFGNVIQRGEAAADRLPMSLVYAGFSMGAMPAQKLAQTRPRAKGALLFHSTIPLEEFGGTWPEGLPVQIHTMEGDEWGDVDVAREFARTVKEAELFLYPGDRLLFADSSWKDYDESAAGVLKERVLSFLSQVG
jgi:dienelactone hydrolase